VSARRLSKWKGEEGRGRRDDDEANDLLGIKSANQDGTIKCEHSMATHSMCMHEQASGGLACLVSQQASPHHIAIIIITLSFPLLLLPALPSNPDVHGGVDGFWLKARVLWLDNEVQ
jgi:hypothetical protein